MTRTRFAPLGLILISAAATAAPPAAPSLSEAARLKTGDTVKFELTRLPESFEGEGRAVCVGSRVAATGPEEARCERAFRFEVRAEEARMTYVFRASKGGKETRISLPITRAPKPVTFVAPSDGALLEPEPTPPLPDAATELAARRVAEQQCAACTGKGFVLESVEVTRKPGAGELPVRLAITPAAPKAAPSPK